MNLLDYLGQYLLSRSSLLRAASIDDAELSRLQQLGAVPQPSYRLSVNIDCASFFGKHVEHANMEYYAAGCAAWIDSVRAGGQPPEDIFVRRYRARLAELQAKGFGSGDVKLNAGLDQHLRSEWNFFLDGTYGLCTRSGLPEDIAAKELAVAIIKELTEAPGERVLTVGEISYLHRAVDLLDESSAPFAPHEVARSSRRRLVDEVRAAYFP
jgi:hypothetical protein